MHTPSLLLLSGSLCDHRLWQYQLSGLATDATISVGDLTGDDSIAGMARRVLDSAPAHFALAGLSLGGIVALEIMRQAPERVQRLALLDTSARPPSSQQQGHWRDIAAMVRGGQLHLVVRKILLPMLIHPGRRSDAWLARVIEDMAYTVGPEAYLRQLAALSARADSRPHLARITCPTLILCGRGDAVCSVALHEEMAVAIPGARLMVIEQCGHLSSLEQPQVITALLRNWLREHSEPESHRNAA